MSRSLIERVLHFWKERKRKRKRKRETEREREREREKQEGTMRQKMVVVLVCRFNSTRWGLATLRFVSVLEVLIAEGGGAFFRSPRESASNTVNECESDEQREIYVFRNNIHHHSMSIALPPTPKPQMH